MFTQKPSHRKGFTLIELLVVIAILGILMAMTLGISSKVTEGSNKANASSQLNNLAQALEQYKLKVGDYPHATPIGTGASETLFEAMMGWYIYSGGWTTCNATQANVLGTFIDPRNFKNNNATYDVNATAAPAAGDYLIDPWGNAYVYKYNSGATGDLTFTLYSYGPDGAGGGVDDISSDMKH